MQIGMALISAASITLATALFAPSAATAQAAQATAAKGVAAGVAVRHTSGAAVGTIARVDGANAVVKTDKYEIAMPVSSFGVRKDGLVITLTQAELNASVEQAMAQAQQSITVGATVRDPQGGTVGTIETMENGLITVVLPSGAKARLPQTAFAGTPSGPLVSTTAAQLEAQVSAATGDAPAASADAGETNDAAQ